MIMLNENDMIFKCVKCNQTFVLRPTDLCPKCHNLVFVEERDVR